MIIKSTINVFSHEIKKNCKSLAVEKNYLIKNLKQLWFMVFDILHVGQSISKQSALIC